MSLEGVSGVFMPFMQPMAYLASRQMSTLERQGASKTEGRPSPSLKHLGRCLRT